MGWHRKKRYDRDIQREEINARNKHERKNRRKNRINAWGGGGGEKI